MDHHDHPHRTVVEPTRRVEVVDESGPTSYALVKYTFLFLMTVTILYFLARFIVPLLR